MPTTLRLHGYEAIDIHRYIELLIHNLVNIKDTTGQFLLKLDDGRIIDTKGETLGQPMPTPNPMLKPNQVGMTGNGPTVLASTACTNTTH